jgi:hypothetical protein
LEKIDNEIIQLLQKKYGKYKKKSRQKS